MSKADFLVAWDLDHTLIDSDHRWEGSMESWIANNTREKILQDKLLPLTKSYFDFALGGYTNICVTARQMNDPDFEFLAKHGLKFHTILHRGDIPTETPPHEVKRIRLQEFFNVHREFIPLYAFEDKPENGKVFEEFGFVHVCAIKANTEMIQLVGG